MQSRAVEKQGDPDLIQALERYSSIVRENYKREVFGLLRVFLGLDFISFSSNGNGLGPDGYDLEWEDKFDVENLPVPNALGPPVSSTEINEFSHKMITHLKSIASEPVPDLDLPQDWIQMMQYTDGITWRGINGHKIHWFCPLEIIPLLDTDEIDYYRNRLRHVAEDWRLELITGWQCSLDNVNHVRFVMYVYCKAHGAEPSWKILEGQRRETHGSFRLFSNIEDFILDQCSLEEGFLTRVTQKDVEKKIQKAYAEATGNLPEK